jgi:hypothetical protein
MKSFGGTRPVAIARTQIDLSAARRVANQFAITAEFIDRAVSDHLSRLVFDGAGAGRMHTAHGDTLRVELERLAAQVSQWSRASTEIAAALRSSAERYTDAELYAAARIA